MTIKLEQYYKDCIRVDGNVLDEDERDYICKTGFYYTLAEQEEIDYSKDREIVKYNVLHISGIDKFLEKCRNDGVEVKCEGFSEEKYLKPKKERENNNLLILEK